MQDQATIVGNVKIAGLFAGLTSHRIVFVAGSEVRAELGIQFRMIRLLQGTTVGHHIRCGIDGIVQERAIVQLADRINAGFLNVRIVTLLKA